MADAFKARTMKRKNVKGLALSAPAKPAAPSEEDSQIPGALGNTDGSRADTLEIGVEFQFDLRSEDLEMIKELGSGNGGTVAKVRHKGWNVVMARKIIHVEAKKEVRKRIVRELQIMHECSSPYIVSFYGAFMNENGDVTMCMEYADVGSLDSISKNFGPVRVDVLGKIAEAVLGGLRYLYLAHKIMHRDIKPSNVLVNSKGQIKLCDFGVSSELVNSVADTFVGTGTYMAPERIQGSPYTVKSDVWSVGLTLMELAIGKFPFSVENEDDEEEAAGPQGILDLLQQIVLEPAPKLPKSEAFPQILEDVIAKCLAKDPKDRPTPAELWDHDPFLQAAKRTPVNLEEWAVSMMERHNRKSHLAPQLSPGSKALLRGENTPSQSSTLSSIPSARSVRSDATPTSGEIPISSASSNGSAPQPRPFPTRTTSAQTAQTIQADAPRSDRHDRSAGYPPQGYERSYSDRRREDDRSRDYERSREYGSSSAGYDRSGGYPPQLDRSAGYPPSSDRSAGCPPSQGYGQMNLPIRGPPPGSRGPRPDTAGSERGQPDANGYRRQKPGYVQ